MCDTHIPVDNRTYFISSIFIHIFTFHLLKSQQTHEHKNESTLPHSTGFVQFSIKKDSFYGEVIKIKILL